MKKQDRPLKLLVVLNYIQLVLLIFCCYTFSSKISLFPWYRPLTSYILLELIILFSIQLVLFFYVWFIYEKYLIFKKTMYIALMSTFILITMFFISIISIFFFYILSLICTAIFFAFSIIVLSSILKHSSTK